MQVKLNSLFNDYELIDSGNGEKLERFGNNYFIRPEISAKNKSHLNSKQWQEIANARYIETGKNTGKWEIYKEINDDFSIKYQNDKIKINCNLFFSSSKHIGIFPEQVLNWIFLNDYYKDKAKINALNLFAYSGSSSLALSPFCNQVTHIDSIKKIVDYAKLNAKISGLENIRFIVEDAMTFVNKEIKRGRKYSCIILDPPPIGVGANGEKWLFSSMIETLLQNINLILENNSVILMNFYLQSFPEDKIIKICKEKFHSHNILFLEKVFGLSKYGNQIDHGIFVRLEK